MFKNETKTRMMAMAVVAMFMLTAFSIALVDKQSDATGDGTSASPYAIYMTEGDSFSYTPTANLAGTSFSAGYNTTSAGSTYNALSTTAASGITFNSSTPELAIADAVVGTYYVKITASWTSGSLHQEAEQYLVFYVTHDLDIAKGTTTSEAFDFQSLTTAKTVGTITVNNIMANTHASAIAWSVSAVNASEVNSSSYFTVSGNDSSATLSIAANTPAGVYTVSVTATQTKTTVVANQSETLEYTVTVFSGATGIAAESITTFLGDNTYKSASSEFVGGNFTVTEWASADSESRTVADIATFDGTAKAYNGTTDELSVTLLNGVANASNFGLEAGVSSAAATGTLTFTATGYTTGADSSVTRSLNWVVNYTVYPNLAFTSTPTLTSTSNYSSLVNPLSVMVSANATGANKVIFNWGDGNVDEVAVNGVSVMVSKDHTYATAGFYQIGMTAVNDFGQTSSITLYNAGNDATLNPVPTHEITIKDGADPSRTLGSIEVEEGKNFRISAIVIDDDAKEFMEGKKIVALYTEAATIDGEKVTFDATKQWKESNIVYSSSPVTLYADVQDTTASDDFFAEHGWIFIVFIILTILAIVLYFYFGIQHPAVLVMAAVFAVFAILCFVYKDFNGIWDAITGIFKSE